MEQEFLQLLNKVINDEISAVAFYKRAALELVGPSSQNVANELKVHADEEMGHFEKLMNYSSNYDLLKSMIIVFDDEVVQYPIQSVEQVMVKVQDLEHVAIQDYQNLLIMCKELKDFTGVQLFKELLEDEIEHYDDLAYVLGQTRTLFPTEDIVEEDVVEGVPLPQEDVVEGIPAETDNIEDLQQLAEIPSKTAASVFNNLH